MPALTGRTNQSGGIGTSRLIAAAMAPISAPALSVFATAIEITAG